MNNPSPETWYMPRWLRSWEQFWFTPAEPSVLGLIRIACGMIVLYTTVAYSYNLQDEMGEHAWHDLQLRMDMVRNLPTREDPLSGTLAPLPPPVNEFQSNYPKVYRAKWGVPPPGPYPKDEEQANSLDTFRAKHNWDLRAFGLTPPKDLDETRYAEEYTERWSFPPPAYPKDAKEEKAIADYMERHGGEDPRRLYARGTSDFSFWFYVTDPGAMAFIHGMLILITVLFTIGFCTRLTAALTWFGNICYIHRNPTILFGADTMMLILLLYLMIGPSGAALSVDRLLMRWWAKAKPGWVRWWYALLKRPVSSDQDIAPPALPATTEPSTSANAAIRLLQIHVCIIYLIAGLAKLQGTSWWNGSALWGTIANYEFAPMTAEWYLDFLKFLGTNRMLYEGFLNLGGLFTLTFEISYAFLVWRPKLRWFYLASAVLLHGGIGLFMGLKSFSLLMLVMNMAFIRPEEVARLFGFFFGSAVPLAPRPLDTKPESVLPTTGIKKKG